MKRYYKITIPKPCHEDWNTMTQEEKGRFCGSCKKTVIDFTKLSNSEVQDYLSENKHQKICGHFKKEQLDTIHISVPTVVIEQSHTFTKTFLLALLLTMGTTLLSCTNTAGKQQKIETVKIVKAINPTSKPTFSNDSIHTKCSKTMPAQNQQELVKTTGVIAPIIREEPSTIDGDMQLEEITGFIIPETVTNLNQPISFYLLDRFPAFPETLSKNRTKENFTTTINKFIAKEFNTNIYKNLGLTGMQKVYVQFEIDKKGIVQNIKVRAPHALLEKEAFRVLQKIPVLIPGIYKDQVVSSVYSLPIIYKT